MDKKVIFITYVIAITIYLFFVWKVDEKEFKQQYSKYKRIFYSIWSIGILFLYLFLDSNKIITLGVNKLGFSNQIMFGLELIVLGIIVENFLVSPSSIKQIFLGPFKLSKMEKEIIQEEKNLTEDLKDMIISEYRLYQDISNFEEYLKEIILDTKQNNNQIELDKVIENFINQYFVHQDRDINAKVYEYDLEQIKTEYKLSRHDYEKLKNRINKLKTFITKKNKKYYMFVPYYNNYIDSEIFVVIESNKELYKIESYIVVNLLTIFEQIFDKICIEVEYLDMIV